MNVNYRVAIAILISTLSCSMCMPAIGQQPDPLADELFDFQADTNAQQEYGQAYENKAYTSSSGQFRSPMTPEELRIARAIYRKHQRIARLEYRQWNGYEPLRPNWNANPMTSSRYGNPAVFYVPVYIYH